MKQVFLSVVIVLLFCNFSIAGTSIGLKGGAATYFGDVDDQQITPYGGLSFDIWVSQKFAVEFLGSAACLQAEEKDPYYYFETRIYSFAALLKLRPLGETVVSPYLLGGIEGYYMSPEDGHGNKLPNNEADVYPGERFGIPFGGGISFFLKENLSLDVEGLYHYSLTDYLDDISSPDKDDGYLTASIGLTFHFVAPKDTDGDGIPDKRDMDPLRAEDFDGFRDADGAPDLDNDEDGIPDVQDKAPLEAEDRDGFEDNDGVPDPDNDGDGILDVNDNAPNEAEDMDGFEDEDGAPDSDNDSDGILDVDDKCPNKAETMNGYEDEDGCPDVKPEIDVAKGEAIVLEGVYFRTGSAQLTPNSREILDKVVRTLKGSPGIEVEIRGYTDNTGRYETNIKLSQKRANSVKVYLVQNGIDAARIQVRGYGPENPIAPNNTRAGRAKNRRIEFFRIK